MEAEPEPEEDPVREYVYPHVIELAIVKQVIDHDDFIEGLSNEQS